MPIDMDRAKNMLRKASLKSLADVGHFILDESNTIAPLEDGTLINSGQVAVDEEKLTVTISYDTPYALRQHEDLELHHENGRRAKFLTSAVDDNRRRIKEYLEKDIQGAFT